MWKKNLIMGVVAVGVVVTIAMAQSQNDEKALSDRYSMDERDGGVVRIDKKTGQVSYCDVSNANIVCRLGADERLAYEAELERLGEQVAMLEKKLELSPVKTKRPNETVPGIPNRESTLDKEFNKAMDFAESAMRRFFKVVQELKEEFKGDRI